VEEEVDKGASMAEQIPEAGVGREVIVYFEPGHRHAGTLDQVSERGIVVRSTREEVENVFWYPLTSVTRLMKDRPWWAPILLLNPRSHDTRTRVWLLRPFGSDPSGLAYSSWERIHQPTGR
jgi:hypothetical protein